MSNASSALAVGEVLVERYRVRERIGAGGMGVVYRAQDIRLEGRQVAIKVLTGSSGSVLENRFRREAKILASIRHPHVVKIHELDELDDGRLFIAMELLEGETLAKRAAREPLTVDEVQTTLRQLCDALGAIHDGGVIHRDLKPENIFLRKTPDGSIDALILDFGIAKSLDSATVRTATTELVGTPQYMAPEQAKGEHELISPRTDVFALGTIAYGLLTGTPAFDGESVYEIVFRVTDYDPPTLGPKECPVPLGAAIAKAMAKHPLDRFSTPEDFARALDRDEPVEIPITKLQATEASTISLRKSAKSEPEVDRPTRQNKMFAWLAFAALAAVTLAIVANRRGSADAPQSTPATDETTQASVVLAAADSAVEALSDADHLRAADSLIPAYRAGDTRPKTLLSLRHAMWPADALIESHEYPAVVTSIDANDDHAVVVSGGQLYRVGESTPMLDLRNVAKAWLSPDGTRALAVAPDGAVVVSYESATTVHRIERRGSAALFIDDHALLTWTSTGVSTQYERINLKDGSISWSMECPGAPIHPAVSGNRAWLLHCWPVRLVATEDGRTKAVKIPSVTSLDVFNGLAISEAGTFGIARGNGVATAFSTTSGETLDARELQGARSLGFVDSQSLLELRANAIVVHDFSHAPLSLKQRWEQSSATEVTAWTRLPTGAIALGTSTGDITVHDAQTGLRIWKWRAHGGSVTQLVANGRTLVSASGNRVSRWNIDASPISHIGNGFSEFYVSGDDNAILGRRSRGWTHHSLATASSKPIDAGGNRTVSITPEGTLFFFGNRAFSFSTGDFLFDVPRVAHVASASEDGTIVVPTDLSKGILRRTPNGYRRLPIELTGISRAISSGDGALIATETEALRQVAADIVIRETSSTKVVAQRKANSVFWLGPRFAVVAQTRQRPMFTEHWSWPTNTVFSVPNNASYNDDFVVSFEDDVISRRSRATDKTVKSEPLCEPASVRVAASGLVAIICKSGQAHLWDGQSEPHRILHELDLRGYQTSEISTSGLSLFVKVADNLLRISLAAETRPGAALENLLERYRTAIE